jgi:hypothetical protein
MRLVAKDKDKVKHHRHEIQALADKTKVEIGEFRNMVDMVQQASAKWPGQKGDGGGEPAPRHLHRQETNRGRSFLT